MLDFAAFAPEEMARAIKVERTHEAERRLWLLRLHDLKRLDRALAARTPKTPPHKPGPLTGAHCPWI